MAAGSGFAVTSPHPPMMALSVIKFDHKTVAVLNPFGIVFTKISSRANNTVIPDLRFSRLRMSLHRQNHLATFQLNSNQLIENQAAG
jgi:hypothetical protein